MKVSTNWLYSVIGVGEATGGTVANLVSFDVDGFVLTRDFQI